MSPSSDRAQSCESSSEGSSSGTSQETGSAVQTILTGRKCWRVLKGKDEPVWPPALEAALIEGLEKYKPTESRSTRALGRFPMRNKFISDYIFETTGKRRTPKQVGSRIQQLRDTNSGKHILKTFSDRHYEMMRPSRPVDTSCNISRRGSGLRSFVHPTTSPAPFPSHVYIEVLPASASHLLQSSSPVNHTSLNSDMSRIDDFRFLGPRSLRSIDPTITFTSPVQVSCYSSFLVFKDGVLVHTEATGLEEQEFRASTSIDMSSMFLYSTTLVPQFWPQLCECSDPTTYVISQEIVRTSNATSVNSDSDVQVMSSVIYHFTNSHRSSPSLSSQSFDDEVDEDYGSISTVSSPGLGPNIDEYAAFCPLGEGFNQNPVFGRDADDLLVPDLVHHDDDGYLSFPPSPADIPVARSASWACFTPSQVVDAVKPCGSYFSAMPLTAPTACFDNVLLGDIMF